MWTSAVNFNFPSRVSGKQNRIFLSGSLLKYQWLVYLKYEDSIYCKMCVLFAGKNVGTSTSQSAAAQLVTIGFNT